MAYGFAMNGKVFTPNETRVAPAENEARNAELEAIELAHWQTRPDRFAAYVGSDRIITTWRGLALGTIVSQSTRRNNFGQRETHIVVRGNNGARYWARYGSDWSQLVRLRRYKAT